MKPVPGLHESVVTQALADELGRATDLEADQSDLSPGTAPHLLGRYVFDTLVKVLQQIPEEERSKRQVELVNELIRLFEKSVPPAGIDRDELLVEPARVLHAVRERSQTRLGTGVLERPVVPLSHSDLLVNGPNDIQLAAALRSELKSADQVDMIVSFVKFNGVRMLEPELAAFSQRHPNQLRVLTTTYMGATEPEGLELLQKLGAQVRVSYDARRTRLHAKAWLFHRKSGFSTALIGSSNLSPAALHDGCEWNVRLSHVDNRTILEKFIATFSQYWADTEVFEAYDRGRFIEEAKYRDAARDALAHAVSFRALPHQTAALNALALERAHGHHRNLVVAATGTGKTIVAALDYARLCQETGTKPTLLFVAHTEEILEQSLAKYRIAVRDGHFGELKLGKRQPRDGRHVFASIQSLHEEALAALQPDAYDVVVIDEFHHAAARSYERLLERLTPKILLGLTATPERADGQSILHWFDGRIATELRLWDALDQNLVVPFQYFGVNDGTDLSVIDFAAGRYDRASLDRLYTADDARARAVLRAVERYVRDPHSMKALGFCVSISHAAFMAEFFTRNGLPSAAVDGTTPDAQRHLALQGLRTGELKAVFAVNLFNEGVDVPSVDTVLFLRPTESATLFLQQLGRGLRLETGKTCLTVLDFIGKAHRKFRFVDRFRALAGGTRAGIARAIEEGFPYLPAGCDIRLDRESQEAVLANVRQSLQGAWREYAADLREVGDVRLPVFLSKAGIELEQLYSGKSRCFTVLKHDAGLRAGELSETEVTRALPRATYVNDDGRLTRWCEWFSNARPPRGDVRDPYQLMLFSVLGFARRPVSELGAAFAEVWGSRDLREEWGDLFTLLADRQRGPTFEISALPLRVHGTYSRHEISAALLQVRDGKLLSSQGGVFNCVDAQADVFYVEIDKDPKHYTPTTLYDDRPISPTRFQWESQAATRADSETGLRYQRHQQLNRRVLLFVRHRLNDERGFTSPYVFLGPVRYHSHESEKPMRILWDLDFTMPPQFYAQIKLAAG